MPTLNGLLLAPAQYGTQNPYLSPDGRVLDVLYQGTARIAPPARFGARTYTPNAQVPARRTINGARLTGYFDDYYHRVHLRPSGINLGDVSVETTRTVEVWNARLTPNNLTSITATGADGITLTGPVPPPTTFAPTESRDYTLTVTPRGEPKVDARFSFAFTSDAPVLRVTGRRIDGLVFPPDWSQPVVDRLEWLTDVIEAHDGTEQRIRLRERPRRVIEYDILTPSDDDRVRLEHLLHAYQARAYGVPIWADATRATAQIPAGATSISTPTTHRGYAAGGVVGLVSGRKSELAEISSVTPSSLTLKTPLTATWPTGTMIVPVWPARVQNDLKAQYLTDSIARATLRCQLEDGWPITAATETADHLGRPVLIIGSDWSEGVDVDYARKLDVIDHLTGRRAVDDLSGIGTVRRTYRRIIRGRSDIQAFLAWLAARAGRLSTCWLPSGQSDFSIVSPIGSSDTSMQVEHRGYVTHVPAAIGRRDIMIETTSGTRYYRRITGASEVSGDVEMIAIDAALGVTLQPSQIRRVSFMRLVRLDSDAVEVVYHTDEVAEIAITLRSVRD